MSTIAVLELEIRPESLGIAQSILSRILAETRRFDGCIAVEAFEAPENSARWVLFQRWESAEHESAYRLYRAGPGAIAYLGDILAGSPILTNYVDAVSI